MPDTTVKTDERTISVSYRGRFEQIGIYLGKFLRMFIYQSDWKVLPMAALVAGLVALVTSASFFVTMEGTLIGSFALVMVCIWNGCFNSIQVICRERDVVKREHRSGMHISSYIISHMIYQALLCLLQTIVTLYVMKVAGMHFELCKPLFTSWFIVDLGISVFLITYASDMMALWISSLARSTTTAMTVIPFVLIFQLVFSGGMIALPDWTESIKNLTISAPGLNVVAAQADYNHLPMVALWNKVQAMGDKQLSGVVTMGQVLDFVNGNSEMAKELRNQEFTVAVSMGQVIDYLHDGSNPDAKAIRDTVLDISLPMSQLDETDPGWTAAVEQTPLLKELMEDPEASAALRGTELTGKVTAGELIDAAVESGSLDACRSTEITITRSLGQLLDILSADYNIQAIRARSFPIKMTVAELQAELGVERIRVFLQETAADGSVKPEYECSRANVASQWLRIMLFMVVFAGLSVVTLEFIDKDKR